MLPIHEYNYTSDTNLQQLNSSNISSDLSDTIPTDTPGPCRNLITIDSFMQKASFLYRFEHDGVVVYDSDARILGYARHQQHMPA